MKKIGLTGGIGSGKTTVARELESDSRIIVDADQIAREIVEPGQPALSELVEAFGSDILDSDGRLIRGELARRAFADEARTELLDSITHPRIHSEIDARFTELERAGADAVIFDMPLLIENGWGSEMDLVIVVDADVETRVRRLVEQRGMDEDDARARIKRQSGDEERRAAADIVIDNNGDIERLRAEVAAARTRIEAL